MRVLSFLFLINILFGKSIPFKVGESLKYEASFSGISAATGELTVLEKSVLNGKSVIHVQFSSRSKGVTDFIFRIQDIIDIWLDEETLVPLKVKKNIHEGTYKKKETTTFFQSNNFAIVSSDTIGIETGTHSPYSLFYFLRQESFDDLSEKLYPVIDGKKTSFLQMDIQKDLTISVPAGTFNCTKVSPARMDKKSFKNDARMAIWFTNDEARIPVQIWLKLKFGALVLKLKTVSN